MKRASWIKRTPIWFVAPLSMGLVGAGLSWWLVERYLEQQIALQPRLPPLPVEERVVLVPRFHLPAGTKLSQEQLATRALEERTLPVDAIEPMEIDRLESRFLAHPVSAGKPIQWLHVVDDTATHLSQLLAPNMRAFTVPMQNDWTHVKQLTVGDRVDLFEQHEYHWQRLSSSAEVLRLSDNFVTFSVPEWQFARLTESYTRQQLRFVLQGIDRRPAPFRLPSDNRPRYFSPQAINREAP